MTEKTPKKREISLTSKNVLSNVLYVKLNEPIFKRLYAISKEFDTNMSAVARLCIETKLNDVEKLYKEIKKLKSAF